MIQDGPRNTGSPIVAIVLAALTGPNAAALGQAVVAFPPGRNEVHSRTLLSPRSLITATAFSPDGSQVAIGSDDGGLWIRDAVSGELMRTLHEDSPPEGPDGPAELIIPERRRFEDEYWPVQALAFSPGGTHFAAAFAGGVLTPVDDPGCEIHVWEVKSGRQVATWGVPTTTVRALAFEPSGRRLCSIDVNLRLATWEVETGRAISDFGNQGQPALTESIARRDTAFGLGSNRAVSLMLDDRGADRPPAATLKLWDRVAERLRVVDLMVEEVGPASVTAELSPDGRRVAVASTDGAVRLLDFDTARFGPSLPVRDRFGRVVLAFSPEGERLVAVDEDGSGTICELPGGRVLRTFQAKPGLIRSLAWYADRIVAVVGGWQLIPSRVPNTPSTVEPLSIWSLPIDGP